MPHSEKNKLPVGPLSQQDILNMDIVFAGTDNSDSCVEQSPDATPTEITPSDETVVGSDSSFIFIDCQSEPSEKTRVKVEDVDKDVDNESDLADHAEQDDYDSNNESIDSLSMKELAVVASHSVDDPNNVIYEVYAVSATTGELSDKPLDLPPDVVEQIRKSMGV